eukprot:6598934-Pyramimonas_sp.AAC.2
MAGNGLVVRCWATTRRVALLLATVRRPYYLHALRTSGRVCSFASFGDPQATHTQRAASGSSLTRFFLEVCCQQISISSASACVSSWTPNRAALFSTHWTVKLMPTA